MEAPDYESPLQMADGRWPDLSDVLLAGERMAFIDLARVKSTRFPRLSRWYVIVTDRRLICLRKSRRVTRQQVHVPLARIEHAYQRGIMGRKVLVVTHRGSLRINGLSGTSGGRLVSLLVRATRGERPMALPLEPAPTGAPALPPMSEAVLTRVEELEAHVDRLTQQVRFLEELMQAKK